MITQNEEPQVHQSETYEPFPKPQTIPSGWDLSGMMPVPQPAPLEGEEDSAES